MTQEFKPEWMDLALDLAKKASSQDEVPVGAIVLKDGKVIGEGYNQRESLHNPLAHAEMSAIYNAAQNLGSWRLLDCKLVVTLEPCPMCLAGCQQARLAEVYYGAKDPKGGAISLGYLLHEDLRLNHRFNTQWVNIPECGHILSQFFKKKRGTE